MSKYVDAEKLLAEIDKRLSIFEHGIAYSCWKSCKKIVESLQQEQPDYKEAVQLVYDEELTPYKDGNQWCFLLGDDIQVGICGFGDTILDAAVAFHKDYTNTRIHIGELKIQMAQHKQPEVDLDFQVFAKEMDNVFALPSSETENTKDEPLNWEYVIARHFYELGLNARKV